MLNTSREKSPAPNGFFATFEEAYAEAQRIRATLSSEDMLLVRVKESPYGEGYVVQRMSAMLEFDMKMMGVSGFLINKTPTEAR